VAQTPHDLPDPPTGFLLPLSARIEQTFDAHITAAREAEKQGHFARARALYNEALHKLNGPAAASNAAAVIRWIGTTHLQEGDTSAAEDSYEASLQIAELNADSQSEGYALNSLGILNWHAGQLDLAEDFYARAKSIAVRTGHARLLAMVSQNQGVIANIRGKMDQALNFYNESLAAYRSISEEQYLPTLLNNLGMIYTDLRNWDEAEQSFAESASLCETLGDSRTRVMVETNLAELFFLKGDLSRARDRCDIAFELAHRYEHRLGLGEVYKWYGVIYRETEKYSLAETHLRSALEIAEQYSSPLLAGETQRELADVYRAQDRNQDALIALNYAQRVFNDLSAELDLADVDRRLQDLQDIFLQVVRKWGESIESKDLYTAGHCERVADYSSLLARKVGFDEQTLVWFRMGAFLHDVGKTAIPAEILNKEGKLSDEEWLLMKEHTVRGVELLSNIEFPWDVRPMVRSHHERWDGTGYPDGLRGRAIPLSARILCVADVFDALTTTRSYRKAFTVTEALEIMRKDSGKIFDAELFSLFEHVVAPEST
jgi:putative nucleotidyltransferase with HDIG domain